MDEFELLLSSCKTAVERWIKARIGNRADAEDILQNTFLAAYQSFPSLKNKNAFLPWILGIAKRKCADFYRKQTYNKELLMENPPEESHTAEDTSVISETLETLSPRDQMMLRLFYYEMLSQKQISNRLHIPEGTVKSRMNTARFHFRNAYPYKSKGAFIMKNSKEHVLPRFLPEYSITWKNQPTFSVICEELPGWFIVPHIGEHMIWGMYDFPSRKLDVSYEMSVTGPARVHSLEGVSVNARVISVESSASENDLIRNAVESSTGGQDEWTFIAQEKDGYTRFLSAEHMENGIRTLTTFLDGENFMNNWGFGEDNCGMPIRLTAQGNILRSGNTVTVSPHSSLFDLAGRCDLMLDGTTYDTVCLMDIGMYMEGIVSEQYIDRNGHTLLWRRFNRDDWSIDRYGRKWSELLPDNEQLYVNEQLFVHWYDCLCLR